MAANLLQQIYNPLVPVALHGPLLSDQSGRPRYWSAIWSVVSSGQLAASTHTKKLRYIEDLYAHADRLLGKHALDDALRSLNETALAGILESWFVSIRNRPNTTRSDEKRWQTGLAFVTSTVTWLSTSGTSNDRLQRSNSEFIGSQRFTVSYTSIKMPRQKSFVRCRRVRSNGSIKRSIQRRPKIHLNAQENAGACSLPLS
jgi:hypothetical protein